MSEPGSGDGTGKGKGSSSEPSRLEPRQQNAGEGCGQSRVECVAPSPEKGSAPCERFYIGDVPRNHQNVVVVTPEQIGNVVNPFWSQNHQREAVVEAFGPGYDVSALGLQPGSNASTPQKVHVGQRGNVDVEMDPVELFRLRCLREAEEKFRQGLLNMGTRVQEPRVEKHGTEKGSYGSQSSYVSALDFQEPAMSKSHAVVETKTVQEPNLSLTVSEPVVPKADETGMQKPVEPFVPRPPPGPPPPSPPRVLNQGYGLGNVTPPIPPALPPFPASVSGNLQNSGGFGENPSENLRTVDLPKLSMDATALQFGDWLSIIDSLMGDLSYTSGDWWMMIRRAVDQSYMDWLNAGPIDRLRLRPQVDSRVQGWPRTERRALSMLLGAIPDPIKEEVISSRKLSTDQVLYKLCITFQPGGASERTKLLQCLTDSRCGSNVSEVLEWVRTW